MKIYNVKVNGKEYRVELESVEEVKGSINKETKTEKVSSGSNEVLSPIGGKVLNVNVKVGDNVKRGDTLCIIEAMKLENEVKSPFDGVVKDIKIQKGSDVANKELLFIIG